MKNTTIECDLLLVREIILKHLQPFRVKVFLFGSQAKQTAHIYSDMDIAILPMETLPPGIIARIKDELEESAILRHVDIVDLRDSDETFRQMVLKEGILWKD
ncbi:MAG: nucleotidyltransferase domain-containing protein [Anaerolineales bacterium]